MSIDTIVYESKNTATRIALLSGGELVELEIVPENRAVEGNIYLGKSPARSIWPTEKSAFS